MLAYVKLFVALTIALIQHGTTVSSSSTFLRFEKALRPCQFQVMGAQGRLGILVAVTDSLPDQLFCIQ